MLNPQIAADRLKEFATEEPVKKQQDRITKLSPEHRIHAFVLLGMQPDGTPFVSAGTDDSSWALRRKQQEVKEAAKNAAFAWLRSLPMAEQETFFGTFFPALAPVLTRYWNRGGRTLYQGSYNRRPFRLEHGADSPEVQQERVQVFSALIAESSRYQEMPIEWFAAWAGYMPSFITDIFGKLFAVAIDMDTPQGDQVFDILLASGRGDHETGAMGRHVVRGLLSASRPDGWEFVGKLLLAAQRQEGLRQSILEVVDEAHPTAFRRMLALIRENDLFRFSATIRAADVWLGMNWVAYEKLSVKQANSAVEMVETFLVDPIQREHALATTTDGQTVYLALWSLAFEDARAAARAAVPLLSDPLVPRRYAALHLLSELRLLEVQPSILSALDDPDLRVAQKAFQTATWHVLTGSDADNYLVSLSQQNAFLSDLLESDDVPPQAHASFFVQMKEAMDGFLSTVTGSKTEKPQTVQAVDDRFERLEQNIPRFPAKKKELEPVIWEWDKLTAHAEDLADKLPNLLHPRPLDRLYPYLPMMSSYGRAEVAKMLGKQTEKTEPMREVLLEMLGDSASYVREAATKAMGHFKVTETEVGRIENLLSRKSADLRKSALSLLLNQDDDRAIESGERLTGSKDGSQRVAGLDLLTRMVEQKRSPEKARAVVATFAATRGDKLTESEKQMLAPLTDEAHEKPTLENALGLMNPLNLTRPAPPLPPASYPQMVSIAALRVVKAIDDLIEAHKETPITGETYTGDADEVLLGNAGWRFPQSNPKLSRDEDLKRFPLREIFESFWQNRPDDLRDPDGLELVRAEDISDNFGFVHALLHSDTTPTALRAQLQAVYDQSDIITKRKHNQTIDIVIGWLLRLEQTPEREVQIADFYLRSAEASLPMYVNFTFANSEKDWRESKRYTVWFENARNSFAAHPEAWSDDQTRRLCRLILWAEHPQNHPRRRIASITEMATALRLGEANRDDMLYHLLGERYQRNQWNREGFDALRVLSSRKGSPLLDTTPGLREIVEQCRNRIIEIELRRGDTETAASVPAGSLRYSGGQEVLLKLIAALGKDTFARGYSYYGQVNRSNVFSHLIRATFPGEGETPELFAQAAKASGIRETRLIEIAMYAPQWARHVETALGWDSFTQGVWWMHAHTKDNSWSVDPEIRETWTAEIADKTPLSAEDLTEGAVDVEWFGRVYASLGEAHWNALDDAAKYASSAGGHKRAQLYADAMRNRLNLPEVLTRIQTKRHQDSLRALGLLPLPPVGDPARETDLLTRYQTMQEFVRTSKQFGAQRQESEKLAARIGMENLARTAGYADPNRLTWAMEAASVADLKDGAVTRTVGEVQVSLAINSLGLPELTVLKKNRVLANIPPAVKKDADVSELVSRKTEITRQVSRMRESLEGAMCRGDKFTGAELATLLEHPVLLPLLRNLVFIEADGKEPILGYPTDAQHLTDCDGAVFEINTETALRIAHPYDLFQTGSWERWQKECFLHERVQPFKQVFRELYLLTDAEKVDATRSRRYTGHQVNPKQALALFGKRGWIGGGEYDYESDGPRKTYHAEGYTVGVGFAGWSATPADVEGSTIEEVRFTKKGDWKPIPLDTVPPRLFSEAMRDLDLVVSVAHVGGVDPEASQSTVEMRAALIREAMELLKITNVRMQGTHAIIDGTLTTYNIHLGSAIVHRQPGGYLCIVPVHSQHRGRLFLPFVDNDPRTAEVISKVLLLARDSEIKDPTILEQILQVR